MDITAYKPERREIPAAWRLLGKWALFIAGIGVMIWLGCSVVTERMEHRYFDGKGVCHDCPVGDDRWGK